MKALPFQKKNIQTAERKFNGRCLIADDMGLGKTAQSLWFVKRARLGNTLPCLIICPRVVRQQWIDTIQEFFGYTPEILETRKPPRNGKKVQRIAVVNYDIIAWWRDWLESQRFKTLILDECQWCKNPSAKRTKTAMALAKQVPFFLPLSGTPMENRPRELYPVVNALAPKQWPNRLSFYHRYCGPKFTHFGWKFDGASNIPELNAKLKQTCMVRNRLRDVMSELPDKVRCIVPVELKDPQQYKKAKDDFIGWMKSKHPERLNKAVKAAALVKSGHLLRLASRLKFKAVVDWINYRLDINDEKLIVYAYHRKCIAALKRRIQANSVVVDGSVTGHKRDSAVEKFKHDKKCRVFIGNIIAAGVGLNLTQASTMCIVELVYKPGPLMQIEARIERIGQKKTAFIYYFIAKDTIEESVSKLVQKKQKDIVGTLDGEYVDSGFDLYDQLLEELQDGTNMAV